jgi:hypothetical protein
MNAAEKLKEFLGYRDFVFIIPGSLIYPYKNLAETDGPLGAAALARCLILGIGARPIFVVDAVQKAIMEATCRGAGINITDPERLEGTERSASIVTFPVELEAAKREAKHLIARYSPKAMIAIERRGRNEKGIYHALPKGRNMNDVEAKMVELFDAADKDITLTIGIGDGANEIGWGIVNDVIRRKIPNGDRCECGCGGGIGDTTTVDVMIAASVSNWGAYGVEACLAVLLESPELLHSEKVEARMLRECIDAGGIDGVTHLPEPGVDGMSGEVHQSIITLLREMVEPKFVYPSYANK